MSVRGKAVAAAEAALNRWADAHRPGWRASLDADRVVSNRSSRAHGYDCVSWEVFGSWTGPNGQIIAAALGVWDTMRETARCGAAIIDEHPKHGWPSEACAAPRLVGST